MKQRIVIYISFILALLLVGCTPPKDQTDVDTNTPKGSVTGGVAEPAENINVKDIDIVRDGDDTVITISMLSGSRAAGYTESKLTNLPEYGIMKLPQPQRLVIQLDNISFWDYEPKKEWALSPFVQGLFREVPADNDSLILYVQLSKNADLQVEEANGDLVIRLTPGDENQTTMYHCVVNAFDEHQEGTWPDDIGMQPVLCSDGQSKLLISEPFETKQQAQDFADSANEKLNEALPGKTAYVIEVGRNALPDYDTDPVVNTDISVVMKDGVLMDTPVLLQNGKFLALSTNGNIAFSRSYKPEEPALQQDLYQLSEKLWIREPNGRIQNIDVSEFYKIKRASFSKDGRYLAILDVSMEDRVLYIYDFETKEPYNLGEEGFGNQTASFAWSDTGNTLYAMTGHGAMQMMSCTFMPDGAHDIKAVEEQAGAEGVLAVSKGRLFFADNFSGENGVIYEIGEERREITTGVGFEISPDGKTMLVLEIKQLADEEVQKILKLCDIETGETQVIVQGTEVVDYLFMHSGSKVYYTDEVAKEPMGDYIYGLYAYDIISSTHEMVALTTTTDFAKGISPGEIYLIDDVEDSEQNFYATFIYDLSL